MLAAGGAWAEEKSDQPWLRPYTGPSRADVDATSLDGKVLCGYQGWFNTPGDGEDFGFSHWGEGLQRPGGRFVVDMWPDVSEYDPHDFARPRVETARWFARDLRAFRKGPVLLHCQWMRQYGIDGVFLSRFVGETASPARPGTSTWCWPMSARVAIAKVACGR